MQGQEKQKQKEKISYRNATRKRKVFVQDVIKCLFPVLSSKRCPPIQHLIQENPYTMGKCVQKRQYQLANYASS